MDEDPQPEATPRPSGDPTPSPQTKPARRAKPSGERRAADERNLQQAAGRAAALVTNLILDFDAQPLADAIVERLGLVADADAPTTILFSELEGFPAWVLSAGDDNALELLRRLGTAAEPAITEHRGRLVKRLGSGHMAVFSRPVDGVLAALDMQRAVDLIEVDGHQPGLKVGLHLGTPQRVDGDYLGTDVNIAARLAEGARPGALLASGQVVEALDADTLLGLRVHRQRGFRAKGTPEDLKVYGISRPPDRSR